MRRSVIVVLSIDRSQSGRIVLSANLIPSGSPTVARWIFVDASHERILLQNPRLYTTAEHGGD